MEKFENNKPISEDDFNSILKQKSGELDEFLHIENSKQTEDDAIFKEYKEKAASLAYVDK